MKKRPHLVWLVPVVALGCTAPRNTVSPAGVDVHQEGDTTFQPTDPVRVELVLTNTTDARISLLTYRTPIAGITDDVLDVTRDGQPVRYQGDLVKRAAPTVEDYTNLEPGQAMRVAFDPSIAYDMSRAGAYEVRLREKALVVDPVIVSVTSDRPRTIARGGAPRCSTSQLQILDQAKTNALNYSTRAHQYLVNDPTDSLSLYRTWFDGSGAQNGWAQVTSNYDKITSAFSSQPVTFDCNCKQASYAYVNPKQPYTITLCRAFWSAPPLGVDSQAGTLVHQMSLFNTTASTNEWVFGQASAMVLADSDWTKATNNADNYEYFAEHQP